MHFEFLVEDQSGKVMLERLVPNIIDTSCHTFKIHAYKGIGRIPKNLNPKTSSEKRILLDQLPRILKGYAKAFASFSAAVIVVCDLDDRNMEKFSAELKGLVPQANALKVRFCIAVEEGEAWLLGDLEAVRKAYPKAKAAVLDAYVNDSICGTWEKLADAIYSGGARALVKEGFYKIGQEKANWAENITPHMNVAKNSSESFNLFKDSLDVLSNM